MIRGAIFHKADSDFCYLTDSGNMVTVVKAKKGDLLKVVMVYDERYDKNPKLDPISIPLQLVMSDELHDYFSVEFQCPYHRMCYYFSLEDQDGGHYYLYQDGISQELSNGRRRLFQMPYLHKEDTPDVPNWLKESVMYQIFPDSFANGRECMEEKPVNHIIKDNIKVSSKYGGNLRGIIENIPYIKDLGITLLYLNPIFMANSYHKYDVVDYYSVDPCFGTKEDLKELVNECHQNGIRVVLDMVYNHSSSSFFAFQDVLKNQESSPYKDWYHIHSFPVQMGKNPNFEAFSYHDRMPKLNTGNEGVEEYLLDAARYWVKECDIDGYRLDVANEVSHEFWRRMRMEMDKIKEDFVLIGEIWHNASSWLGRDQFHSVMNFPVMDAVWDFFGLDTINAQLFGQTINRLTMQYRKDHSQAMMNFIDNHDTERFLSLTKVNYDRQKIAAAFVFTYVGMPSVYYGDEKAMEGNDNVDCRRRMIWQDDETNASMHGFYRKMIQIRTNNPTLIYGDYQPLIADALTNQFGFIRSLKDQKIICLFNNSTSSQEITIEEGVYLDLLNEDRFSHVGAPFTLSMEPFGVRILKKEK